MSNVTVDGDRLWQSLMTTAEIGGTPKGGINRQTLTDEDRKVRDWFAAACTDAGCAVSVDSLGNMFARRPGRDNSLPPICIGSHLDTQPTGGKFDGVLGVLAGLEVLRSLNDAGYETTAPIEVVNWTNEEGARFSPAMLASGVFAGVFSAEYAQSRVDQDGVKFGDALDRIGYRGNAPVGDHPMSAMFELHIEQGPVLELEDTAIGVVSGVQGVRWYELTIAGRDSHSGSTPMTTRQDALVAASKVIQLVRSIGLAHEPHARSTVGRVEVRPNSPNVVPGEVFLTVDLRHPDGAVLKAMGKELEHRLRREVEADGLALNLKCIWNSPPVEFDKELRRHIRRAADRLNLSSLDIVSGAGHDAAYVARVAPTAMVFVPCRDGISHNEEEYTTQDQCTAGAAVLLESVLSFDRSLQRQLESV
ncbi:Zn-dependent hydrolase [Afipia sp. Root123D2]|uniref:Zn-dependent hydrolase n=1 Tax=Afipia sp. Root123D2 TaxID=1736436 RepID=UPI0006FC80A7|nr:Zn-dependent hydrolase [Afipia sp. Root123D2]KQW20994.1 Zn-dependent hydrolase [Afipia sp. Root123D2]